jgi:hypothetical protein
MTRASGSWSRCGTTGRCPRAWSQSSQGLGHLQALERLYADYYGALARSEFHPDALDEFLIDLETHRFGFYRRLGPFRLRQSIARGPRVFVALYGVLIAISAVLVVVEATTNLGG